jgi:hypothetical protein
MEKYPLINSTLVNVTLSETSGLKERREYALHATAPPQQVGVCSAAQPLITRQLPHASRRRPAGGDDAGRAAPSDPVTLASYRGGNSHGHGGVALGRKKEQRVQRHAAMRDATT